MLIEQFVTLDVGTLSAAGMFQPGTRQQMQIQWNRGTDCASITAVTDCAGYVPFVLLSYYWNGQPVEQSITIRFRPVNRGGFVRYFVCPVSGLSCLKLYFSEERGQFIGRVATRAKYLQLATRVERLAVKRRPYRWQMDRNNLHPSTV